MPLQSISRWLTIIVFSTSFLLMDKHCILYFPIMLYQYTCIKIFIQRFFYSSYLQCKMVWYGPCVNIHSKNLVEQNHLHNWNSSCALRFPGSVPGSNSTECWYIPQVWWVQILPKETPLSVEDENKMTFPNPLPTNLKEPNFIATALECPLLFMTSKIFACEVPGAS